MIDSYTSLLTQTATVREYLGTTGNGEKKYGEHYEIKCRIEPKNARITDKNGQQIITSGKIFLKKGTRIPEGSKITYDNSEYTLISTKPEYAPILGEHHASGWLS
ncbi:hypothetical protein AGMMS49975_22890 [Clostridia bacterium]|nr:hypothetical protein AGMMS49975_22890 [Clostridia bacterium]